jgi:phosphoadenosine phosphosulfate reductase
MDRLAELTGQFGRFTGEELLSKLRKKFGDKFVILTSAGTEAWKLLNMAAAVDPEFPIWFVDTGELFDETYQNFDLLTALLGLTNIRTIRATREELSAAAKLWESNRRECCDVRKIRPFLRAYDEADIQLYASGKRRDHGGTRTQMKLFEVDDYGHIRVNPNADVSSSNFERERLQLGLPPHELVKKGYPSVGCLHCTERNEDPSNPRAGRLEEGGYCGLVESVPGDHGARV